MKWNLRTTILILIATFGILAVNAYADDTITDATTTQTQTGPESILKAKIDERNAQIKQLETEINQYNTEITNIGTQKTTLNTAIKTLDLSKKKITADINLTQNKITKTALTIDQLNTQIGSTKKHIDTNKEAVMSAIQDTQILEDTNLVQLLLSTKSLNDLWGDIDNNEQIQSVIRDKSKELAVLKSDLETKQTNLQGQKKSLTNLKQDLTGKKQAIDYTVKTKAQLLAETKNKEQTYVQLVRTKEEQKAQFEAEVYDFESQLNLTIDKGRYPIPKHGILAWPVDNVFITQKFGKTVGAEKLYVSGSHNGVDFRASIGTKVKSVLDGVISGTGNTDIYPGCYSFGKWVMVKHDNGLSSIYGHLSVISVSKGDRVSTGDLIGYSGNTGYSTGPHLHLGIYATQGVRIEQFLTSRGCKQAIIPLADIKAYLDPLVYLPSI